MPESFGARLRSRREERQMSLRTIADQTKIKLSLLEGLERDDISRWPAGLYRRAYIRAYAHAIGLDSGVVVREFLERHPEPVEVIEPPAPAPPRLRSLVGTAVGSLSRLRRRPASETAVTRDAPAAPSAAAVAVGTAGLEITADSRPAVEPDPPEPDLLAAARLCTELGRAEDTGQVHALLREAASILDAVGLIVWVWDAPAAELRPVLVHGYSDRVLAKLRGVGRDADNMTAAAFRSGQTRDGCDRATGALVVPLLTPAACAGVLAIELPPGRERAASVRAVATFIAAMLAQLIGVSAPGRPSAVHSESADIEETTLRV